MGFSKLVPALIYVWFGHVLYSYYFSSNRELDKEHVTNPSGLAPYATLLHPVQHWALLSLGQNDEIALHPK